MKKAAPMARLPSTWVVLLLVWLGTYGLLTGGVAQAHAPDPAAVTGTIQHMIDYDPFHPQYAGVIRTQSAGMLPFIGATTCTGESHFLVDFTVPVPAHTIFAEGECEAIIPYRFTQTDITCTVAETDRQLALEVTALTACFPPGCFVFDETHEIFLSDPACTYTTVSTTVFTDALAEMRMETQFVETRAYTHVVYDADRQRAQVGLSGTLDGRVRQITFGPAPTETNRRVQLELPGPGMTMSGIIPVAGWACAPEPLEAEITNGLESIRFPLPHGADRQDTAPVCGDTRNGFSAVFNWNLLDAGAWTILIWRAEELVAEHPFFVAAFEEEFLTEVSGQCTVHDFPTVGQRVTVEWEQAIQNFLMTERPEPE